jgi:hypothetical protein
MYANHRPAWTGVLGLRHLDDGADLLDALANAAVPTMP